MAMSVVYETFCGQIVSENRGGVERDYGCDTLGSTVALYDSSQNKTDEWTYWPYGEIRSHVGSSTTPFTFVGTLGYYMDQAAQLYVRARCLMTSLARWLTVDPLWPNERAYAYVAGRPQLGTDASGLDYCDEKLGNCRIIAAAKAALCETVATGACIGGAKVCGIVCVTGNFIACGICYAALAVICLVSHAACIVQYGRWLDGCLDDWCACKTSAGVSTPGCNNSCKK
jgi:RHS repeat-associated protein